MVTMSAPAATYSATFSSGSSIIKWTSLSREVLMALMNGGPTVIMGQKQPSITSKCASFAPVLSKSAISEPSESRLAVTTPMLTVGAAARSSSRHLDFAMGVLGNDETRKSKLENRRLHSEFRFSNFEFRFCLLAPHSHRLVLQRLIEVEGLLGLHQFVHHFVHG